MIGSIVGNYRITERIGEGGMGAVYKGVDLMLEREVAIKALRPELARQPELLERFRTEAVTLARLNHQNIATLYSFFCHNDEFFMVMEFVRGETLDKILQRQGPMRCEQALPLFFQALAGIEQAHSIGVVHRDVKPANMMVTANGTLKVMDFGIARVLGTNRMTRQGYAIGTLQYMSPEQIRGDETDARSDIYSLGILLYEMLTGHVPFRSNTEYELMRAQIEETPPPPKTIAQHIPTKVEEVIMRALAKGSIYRYQTVGEFSRALTTAWSAVSVSAQPQAGATVVFTPPAITRDDHLVKTPTDPNAVTNWNTAAKQSQEPAPKGDIGLRTAEVATVNQSQNQPATPSGEQNIPQTVRFDSGAAKAFSSQYTGESMIAGTVRFDPAKSPSGETPAQRSNSAPTVAFQPQPQQSVAGNVPHPGQGPTSQVQQASTSPQPLKKSSPLKALAIAAVVIIFLGVVGGGAGYYLVFMRKAAPASSTDTNTPANATVPSVPTPSTEPASNPPAQTPDAQQKPAEQPSNPAVVPDNTTAGNDDKDKADDKTAGTKGSKKKNEETAAEKAKRKKAAINALDH